MRNCCRRLYRGNEQDVLGVVSYRNQRMSRRCRSLQELDDIDIADWDRRK